MARETLSAEAAKKLIAAAEKKAEELKKAMVIAICGDSGNRKAFPRMDNALLISVQIAQDKAWSAISFGIPTRISGLSSSKETPPLLAGIVHTPRLVVFGGAIPSVSTDRSSVGSASAAAITRKICRSQKPLSKHFDGGLDGRSPIKRYPFCIANCGSSRISPAFPSRPAAAAFSGEAAFRRPNRTLEPFWPRRDTFVPFRLDKHSDLPVVSQLEVQIKIALLLGRLRPGDTLPSIRDVEKQLGISRNFVLQAYRSLEKNGILRLHHGKGVLVREQVSYDHKAGTLQKAEQLAQGILKQAETLGIVPSAFGRYLDQEAIEMKSFQPRILYADVGKQIAAERASYISSFWRMNIPPVSLDELAEMPPEKLRQIMKILTLHSLRRGPSDCKEPAN